MIHGGAIERAGPNDLMQLAVDVGPVPMQIGAVVLLEPPGAFDLAAGVALLGRRIARVRRLRQRLVRPPLGCGRAYWVDDAGFDPGQQIEVVKCAQPSDEGALLAIALRLVARRLTRSKPLWSATFVTGLTGDRVALVFVLHHVVADGLGGLAVLGALVDPGSVDPAVGDPAVGDPAVGDPAVGDPAVGDPAVVDSAVIDPAPGSRGVVARSRFPRPAPSRRALAAEAWTSRLRAAGQLPARLRRLGAAVTELGVARPGRAPRTSLNQPTGSRREARVVRIDLAAVVDAAHRHGGTVNDVVLAAVTGALGTVLAARGETVPRLVVSVPVSAPRSAAEPGNQVGVIPMTLPTGGDALSRLTSVIAITRTRKLPAPGASAALLQPAFGALAALGVLHWFVNHQRMVNTFVTNVRGPVTPMTFSGAAVTEIVPLAGGQGNATVAFAVLSYAGALLVTVVADPDAVPELATLTAALQGELAAMTTAPGRMTAC